MGRTGARSKIGGVSYQSVAVNEFNFNVHERMMRPTDAPYKRRETEMQTEKERDVEKTRSGTGGHGETPRTLNAY